MKGGQAKAGESHHSTLEGHVRRLGSCKGAMEVATRLGKAARPEEVCQRCCH